MSSWRTPACHMKPIAVPADSRVEDRSLQASLHHLDLCYQAWRRYHRLLLANLDEVPRNKLPQVAPCLDALSTALGYMGEALEAHTTRLLKARSEAIDG